MSDPLMQALVGRLYAKEKFQYYKQGYISEMFVNSEFSKISCYTVVLKVALK